MSFNVCHRTGRRSEIVSTHDTHSEAAAERNRLNAEEREANGGRLQGGHWYECDDPVLTRWIAYDVSDLIVWGTGDSEEAARSDALDWISRNAEQEDQLDIRENLTLIRCTDELAGMIETTGGNTRFSIDHDQYGEHAK